MKPIPTALLGLVLGAPATPAAPPAGIAPIVATTSATAATPTDPRLAEAEDAARYSRRVGAAGDREELRGGSEGPARVVFTLLVIAVLVLVSILIPW
jgi:hypothetical protein